MIDIGGWSADSEMVSSCYAGLCCSLAVVRAKQARATRQPTIEISCLGAKHRGRGPGSQAKP